MLVNALCPRIQFLSFTCFLVLLITSLYVAMLSIGGVNKNSDSGIYILYMSNLGLTFLLISKDALESFGGNNPYNVKYYGEIYLWLTSIFLVQDFL
jgi:archaellum biogenesis protein FlaJ (TadC family)